MLNEVLAQQYIRPLRPRPAGLKPSGQLTAAIECLLFDIYGTLFISGSGDIGIARNKPDGWVRLDPLLVKYGIRMTSRRLLREYFKAIEAAHQKLNRKGIDCPEVQIDHIWQSVLGLENLEIVRAFALEFELISNPVYPMPNLSELLKVVRQAGIPMGIISNAQFYTPYLFSWFLQAGPEDLGFDPKLIYYSYLTGHAKPSLHMYQKALGRCKNRGIRPESILYLGNDMLNDMMPAAQCGMQTALFAGDLRSLRLRSDDPRCRAVKPDLIITDLRQLIDWI